MDKSVDRKEWLNEQFVENGLGEGPGPKNKSNIAPPGGNQAMFVGGAMLTAGWTAEGVEGI